MCKRAGRVAFARSITGTPSRPIEPMAWKTGMRSPGRGCGDERASPTRVR